MVPDFRDGGGFPSTDFLAHHFENLEQQRAAESLGMWAFLATEILFFGALFTGYAVYRFQFPDAFAECSRHLELTLGTVNTLVLITSSLTVALAIHYARTDRRRAAAICLVITLLFALSFLGIKAIEYAAHFHERSLPGKYYAYEAVKIPGADDYQGPREFRKDLLDAMKREAPKDYRDQVKRYYEELAR